MNDFTQLKNLLPKIAAKHGVAREVRSAMIRDRARHAVRHIWGEDSEMVHPLYFKEGTLFIEVANAAWGQEVFFKKQEILGLIGAECKVKDIKTRLAG